MSSYKYLIKNDSEFKFLLEILKEENIDFYDWILGSDIEFNDDNEISIFCEPRFEQDSGGNLVEINEYSWCDNCDKCHHFGCNNQEVFKNIRTISVNSLMRSKKLERILNE